MGADGVRHFGANITFLTEHQSGPSDRVGLKPRSWHSPYPTNTGPIHLQSTWVKRRMLRGAYNAQATFNEPFEG